MRCATLVPKSGDPRIVLVALGFLSYCLYTDADSAAGNLVASLATTTLPVPYDTFSLGMVAVLGAGASLPRVCTLLFDEKFLMAGIALMTIGPLYSMLVGAGYAVYVLAFCGGLGKAVVLLHLGRCLFLLGARSAFYVVAAMGALSALAAPILSLHHAAFSLASLVAAPVCGWCLYRASIAKAPCAGADKDDAIGLDGTVRDFPRYIAMVVILASCTILLLDPMTGGSDAPTELHTSLLTLGAAVVSLVVLFLPSRNSEHRLWRAFKVMIFCFIVAACGFFAFACGRNLWTFGTLVGCVLFQAIFFATAPFAAWGSANKDTESIVTAERRFAMAALAYCAALSMAIFLCRILLDVVGASCFIFIGVLAAVTGLFSGITAGMGSQGRRSCSYEELWTASVVAIARENGLSARETEVFSLAARGYDSRAIQARLVISPSTVSTHLQSIYKKLDLHSRQDLIQAVEESLDRSQ